MLLTVRAVVEALEASSASDRPGVAREVTRSALLGARGNSGVILSQVLRGAAEALADPGAVDAAAIARALRGAADAAYAAVRQPVEGTMLTVARAAADAAEAADPDTAVAELLVAVLRNAEEALERTPELLEVLRAAGVVDAGAAGVVELLRGIVCAVRREPVRAPEGLERERRIEATHHEPSRYRYCTTFVVEGKGLDAKRLEEALEPLGDSLLVVGDGNVLKAHVHTDEPGAALAAGTAVGLIDRVEIANMQQQSAERAARLAVAPGRCAVVAVVAGEGNRRLFESLGVTRVVEGGQTMNPAAAELVAAVEATDAPEVILLPNNDNVVMSAEQAARLVSKPVRVVPTDSIQRGLAAMVEFEGARSADENAGEMEAALAAVATGAVTAASRDSNVNGIAVAKGDYLGLVEGEAVAAGASFAAVVRAVVERLLAEPRGLLTLLTGDEEPDLALVLEDLRGRCPDLEIEVHAGGQPHYHVLIAAE